MSKTYDVAITACPDYAEENLSAALKTVISAVDGLGWVKPGMRVAIKANLVSAMKPETAAPTHPAAVKELCRMITALGATPIVGDSPGGLWTPAAVGHVYSVTGMEAVEEVGGVLNKNYDQRDVQFPEGAKMRDFPFTAWLDDADGVIDFCKLKTHGMMGMSCAVKNLYGVIPGTRKAEFHYRFPAEEDFANMLVDLNEFVKPRLAIVDAVDCMEGNGPTQGTVRHMGALLAAGTTYNADLVCAGLIGLKPEEVATVRAAAQRGLCPDAEEKLSIFGDPGEFAIPDFEKLPARRRVSFGINSPFIHKVLEKILTPIPKVDKDKCIGCGVCARACPQKTIEIKDKKAIIKRSNCISCFCCQEFCPKGAITVGRTPIARLVGAIQK